MLKFTNKDIKAFVLELAKKIKKEDINAVYGIPRGGYAIAIELAKVLKLPVITDEAEITKKTLIVDDLVDSGKTISKYKI